VAGKPGQKKTPEWGGLARLMHRRAAGYAAILSAAMAAGAVAGRASVAAAVVKSVRRAEAAARFAERRDYVPAEAVKILADKRILPWSAFTRPPAGDAADAADPGYKPYYREMADRYKRSAFEVAFLDQVDVVKAVQDSLTTAIRTGLPRTQWRERLNATFAAAGVAPLEPWHARLVFHMNVKGAYSAAQWDMLHDPDVADLFPFYRYVTVGDTAVRQSHAAQAGKVFPADHEFWKRWWPPNDWNCRCDVDPVDRYEAERLDLKPDAWDGATPPAGFDGNPGTAMEVRDELSRIQAEIDRQRLLRYDDGFVLEDRRKTAAYNRFVGKEFVRDQDRWVTELGVVNVAPAGTYPTSVPQGEVWVDWQMYSQKWHVTENLLLKAKAEGLPIEGIEVLGRATAADPAFEWSEYEQIDRNRGTTEMILRWRLKDAKEASRVASFLADATSKDVPNHVRGAWDAADVRVWGAEAGIDGFRPASVYRAVTGDGREVLTLRKGGRIGRKAARLGLKRSALRPQINEALWDVLKG
jgi:SPP1 gp7 family putative phage head morphogenesis protein